MRLRSFLPLLFLVSAMLLQSAAAQVPSWWGRQGVLTTDPEDDYAALNHGQLKNLVRAAVSEMENRLTDGAGATLTGMLAQWRASPGDDFTAVNVGQLKAMAALVRGRLAQAGTSLPGLGTSSSADDDDYAVANIGQAKAAFSVDIENQLVAEDDYDGDGLSNGEEVIRGTLPRVADTDGDGLSDGDEVVQNTDPKDTASNVTILLGLRVFTPLDRL